MLVPFSHCRNFVSETGFSFTRGKIRLIKMPCSLLALVVLTFAFVPRLGKLPSSQTNLPG